MHTGANPHQHTTDIALAIAFVTGALPSAELRHWSSMMRPPPETNTRPQLRRPRPVPLVTVAVSVALVSLLCLPVAADASRALHYSRDEHRRHQHHRARESKKNNHVSLPPDADGGDSPPEPPEAGGAGAPPPPLPPPAEDDDCGGDVFDVRAFGASGSDGGSCSDDTPAFRAAWKAACSSDSATATLLVPSDGVFTIGSTIFSGPCKPELTFQVSFELHCLCRLAKLIIDPSQQGPIFTLP